MPPTPQCPSRRLLWLHQNFVSAREGGNSRPVHLAAAFLEAGWRVDVVCSQRTYLGDRAGTPTPAVRVDREGALTLHRLPTVVQRAPGGGERARSYAAFATRSARYLRTFGGADLVYASTPPLPQVLPSVLAAVRFAAPLVLEVRDLWPAFLVDGGMVRSRPLAQALYGLEAWACRFADHLVAVSPGFEPYLCAVAPGVPLTTAPTGGDPVFRAAEQAAGAAWRRAEGLEDRLVVLYAGSFNRPYRLGTLLEAAARTATRAPQVMWLFAGNGEARPEVARAAARLPNVRYLGSLPKDRLLPALLGADLGLNARAPWPLLDTTITGKLFDYLAAGLPVVSLSGGQTGEILRAAGAGAVAPATPEALAGAVARMARLDPAERHAMGQRGQRWVLRHMAAPDMARRVAEAVEETAARAACSRMGRARRAAEAAALAARDVQAGRARRVIAEEYLPPQRRAKLIHAAFARWMQHRASWEMNSTPLPIPSLLSARRG